MSSIRILYIFLMFLLLILALIIFTIVVSWMIVHKYNAWVLYLNKKLLFVTK